MQRQRQVSPRESFSAFSLHFRASASSRCASWLPATQRQIDAAQAVRWRLAHHRQCLHGSSRVRDRPDFIRAGSDRVVGELEKLRAAIASKNQIGSQLAEAIWKKSSGQSVDSQRMSKLEKEMREAESLVHTLKQPCRRKMELLRTGDAPNAEQR